MPTIEFPAGVTPEEAVELARQHSPHLFADSKPEVATKDTRPARGPAPEPLLTPAEVSTLFRCDVKTVTRWAQAGKLHSIRTPGGHRRFFENEVNAMLRGEPWELPAAYVNAAQDEAA